MGNAASLTKAYVTAHIVYYFEGICHYYLAIVLLWLGTQQMHTGSDIRYVEN